MNDKSTMDHVSFRGDPIRTASLARLAGGFAHDMNNILGAIEGYAVLAAGSLPADSQARRDMESVSEAVKAAAELTGRMLLFGRRRALKKEACRPAEAVEAAAARARAAAPAGVTVVAAAASAAPLQADADRLALALELLVKNALAAMPAGGQLTLGAEPARAKGPAGTEEDFVRFFVRDTGDGMSPEVLEHLFEPYYPARPGGKGLDLAIVDGIAALHGGWAEARSAHGRGGEVSVCLPLNPR